MSRRSMSARAAALVYLTPHDRELARGLGRRGLYRGVAHAGFDADLRHAGKGARDPHRSDQLHGLPQRLPVLELGAERAGTTGKKADPRSFCIQKTLQAIRHSDDVEFQLMFAGHNAYRFEDDPFYANGYVPTVKELVERLVTGD